MSSSDNKAPPLAPKVKKKADYYTKGSMEVATETALTIAKLEKRRKLTRNSERVVIVLVGLPGRGKSFVARKLQTFLNWRGTECKVFNVGKYRREAAAVTDTGSGGDDAKDKRQEAGSCDANFFDSKNEAAAKLRQEVAALALKDMLKWLDRPDDQHQQVYNSTIPPAGSASGGSGSEPSSPRPAYHRSMSTTANSVQNISIDRVAIFDATNSTVARRQWVLEECTSPIKRANKPTGVVFVESICDDQELLDENFRFKIQNSPDFQGMTEEEGIADLRKRVQKYEEQYETIEDDALSYIKIYNLSSKVMVNHIYGRMAKVIVPALMSWNIGSRPIYICRAGDTFNVQSSTEAENEEETETGGISQVDTFSSVDGRGSPHSQGSTEFGTVGVTNGSRPPAAQQHHRNTSALLGRAALSRGGNLSEKGEAFRDALCDFLWDEGREFMMKRSKAINLTTGTSRDGLSSAPNFWEADLRESVRHLHVDDDEDEDDFDYDAAEGLPFPCHVMASTMPRAYQTATWEQLPYPVEVLSNLNPLDKGDFTGYELEEIAEFAPDWYARLEADPFRTRFPGGECYQDLINRLEPAVIDMEQQVGLVVVVSHVSVIQTLMSYFRCTPVQKSAEIAVPIHTVIKFTPARGGGWAESHHKLLEDEEVMVEQTPTPPTIGMIEKSPMPIWGDHKPLSRANSMPPVKDLTAKLSVPDIHN
jgi:broad specificity phosphatase PhoE